MTRLSGIQILALSLVLWAVAVWFVGAPRPAATKTAAMSETTETTAGVSGEKTEESGTSASESALAAATTVPSSAAPANQGSAAPPSPDTEVGSSASRGVSEHTGTATASVPSSSGAPPVPAAGTPTPPDATGEGSRVALAPADGVAGVDATTSGGATEAGSVAGSPIAPRDSAAGSARERAGSPGALPAADRPHPWIEQPLSRPPPSARSGVSAADANAVADQINAARRAAWEGRFADALAQYRATARLQPDNYVVWGEMGNVLWTMRRWSEAAYALEGTATLLVRSGELRAANELVPAVGRLDPDAAYRVQRLLWAAAQGQSG